MYPPASRRSSSYTIGIASTTPGDQLRNDDVGKLVRFVGTHRAHPENSPNVVPIRRLETHRHFALAGREFSRDRIVDVNELLVFIRAAWRFYVVANPLPINQDVERGFSPSVTAVGHPQRDGPGIPDRHVKREPASASASVSSSPEKWRGVLSLLIKVALRLHLARLSKGDSRCLKPLLLFLLRFVSGGTL